MRLEACLKSSLSREFLWTIGLAVPQAGEEELLDLCCAADVHGGCVRNHGLGPGFERARGGFLVFSCANFGCSKMVPADINQA